MMTIVAKELAGRTVMVLGGPGTGKTAMVRELARQLAEEAGAVAVVSADMGQQSVGVPTCLGLSFQAPHDHASAMWFIGDVSPGGNLLPATVGAARLVARARAQGATTVLIDTTGLIDSGPGFALKYHKALAAGVDCVVALERAGELKPVLGLLAGICPTVHHAVPTPDAKDRSAVERRAYRQECYRLYFQGADALQVDAARLVGTNWMANPLKNREYPAPGTVVGLLDNQAFCLAIGLVEKILPTRVVVFTPWSDPAAVAAVKVGRIHLDRQAEYAEGRPPQ
jgi:polynucleotide 5'-kinase involved in rRNA processing